MRKRKFILTVESGKFNWRENELTPFYVVPVSSDTGVGLLLILINQLINISI